MKLPMVYPWIGDTPFPAAASPRSFQSPAELAGFTRPGGICMPLPPLPENNTVRAWLKYTAKGTEHEMCFRLPAGSTSTDIISTADDLAAMVKGYILTTDSILGLRASAAGSDLSFPLPWTPIAGLVAASAEADEVAKFLSVTGRSSGGYRCRLTVFAPTVPDTAGYRINTPTDLRDAADSALPALVAIDGGVVFWNGWTNVGYNAYWQRKSR